MAILKLNRICRNCYREQLLLIWFMMFRSDNLTLHRTLKKKLFLWTCKKCIKLNFIISILFIRVWSFIIKIKNILKVFVMKQNIIVKKINLLYKNSDVIFLRLICIFQGRLFPGFAYLMRFWSDFQQFSSSHQSNPSRHQSHPPAGRVLPESMLRRCRRNFPSVQAWCFPLRLPASLSCRVPWHRPGAAGR